MNNKQKQANTIFFFLGFNRTRLIITTNKYFKIHYWFNFGKAESWPQITCYNLLRAFLLCLEPTLYLVALLGLDDGDDVMKYLHAVPWWYAHWQRRQKWKEQNDWVQCPLISSSLTFEGKVHLGQGVSFPVLLNFIPSWKPSESL